MVIKDLKGVNCIGVIDRIEGRIAILETADGFVSYGYKNFFPFKVIRRHSYRDQRAAKFLQDKLAEERARERAIELLIDWHCPRFSLSLKILNDTKIGGCHAGFFWIYFAVISIPALHYVHHGNSDAYTGDVLSPGLAFAGLSGIVLLVLAAIFQAQNLLQGLILIVVMGPHCRRCGYCIFQKRGQRGPYPDPIWY